MSDPVTSYKRPELYRSAATMGVTARGNPMGDLDESRGGAVAMFETPLSDSYQLGLGFKSLHDTRDKDGGNHSFDLTLRFTWNVLDFLGMYADANFLAAGSKFDDQGSASIGGYYRTPLTEHFYFDGRIAFGATVPSFNALVEPTLSLGYQFNENE